MEHNKYEVEIFLMRSILEKGKWRQRWCVSRPLDPRSLSAAYLEEVEVIPPREEWPDDSPPKPQKMTCLPEL